MKEVKHADGSSTFHDEESGFPVAKVKKAYSYGRDVTIEPHPDLVKHFPDVGHTYYGLGKEISGRAGNKADAQSKIASFFSAHSHNDFKNKVNIKKEHHSDNKNENTTSYHFHDAETGDKIASLSPVNNKEEEEKGNSHKLTLNRDYLDKHDINDDIIKSKTGLPTRGFKSLHSSPEYAIGSGKSLHSKMEELTKLKGKKATLVGVHQSDSGDHKTYKVNGSAEQGSSAHERHLRKGGYSIDRATPTSFVAKKLGTSDYSSDEYVHSHVDDGHLHAVHTKISPRYQYAKKNSELIESTNIENILFLVTEDKYSYIKQIAKLINK